VYNAGVMTRPEFLLLLFVPLFSTLAFGAVEPWSIGVAEVAACVALALALHRRAGGGVLRVLAAPGALPLLLLPALALAQLAPLPPALLALVSPGSLATWQRTLGAAGPLPWVPVSIDPASTLRELVRLGALAALYLAAVELLARRERLRALGAVVAVFAAALALEALLQHLAAPRRLLLVRLAPPDATPFGPFVNRNHYADLAAMLLPVLLGLALGRGTARGARSLRGRLALLLADPAANARTLLGFAALLAAASLAASLSRAGIVAAAAGVLVFLGFLFARGLGRSRAPAALLLAAALALVGGWFGWGRVAARFATIGAGGGILDTFRDAAWRDTLRMAGDFPVFGAGLGAFWRLYPHYQSIPERIGLAHAHNDYLELLAGGGAVGLALFLWFVGAALLAAVRLASRRAGGPALHLAYGAIGGCAAFLAHAAVDFPLAIGANAFWFVLLLAVAVSAAAARPDDDGGRTELATRRAPALVARVAAVAAAAVALLVGADLSARHAWGLADRELRRADALEVTPPSARRLIELAARLSPFDAAYPGALARAAARAGDRPEAVRLTARALRLSPTDPALLEQLALLLAGPGASADARRAFEAAVAFDPRGPRRRESFGSWLLARGETGPALEHLRRAMALDPDRVPEVIALLVLAGFDDARIAAVVPDRAEALLALARYLAATGKGPQAEVAYRRVLALDPRSAAAADGLRALARPPARPH
jgi:O-antigen ligase/Flp pilus assembly protein TadD